MLDTHRSRDGQWPMAADLVSAWEAGAAAKTVLARAISVNPLLVHGLP
jgi:hypothetical protein